MPEIVQSNAQAANPAEAIALAPGVWTAFPEGTTVAQAAAGGKLFGWCGPVKDYAEKAGGRGYTCY